MGFWKTSGKVLNTAVTDSLLAAIVWGSYYVGQAVGNQIDSEALPETYAAIAKEIHPYFAKALDYAPEVGIPVLTGLAALITGFKATKAIMRS